MFVTLFATVCLNLAVEGTCVQEVVTDSQLSPDMSFAGCLGAQGQVSDQTPHDENVSQYSHEHML
jgi:hypothetical protein